MQNLLTNKLEADLAAVVATEAFNDAAHAAEWKFVEYVNIKQFNGSISATAIYSSDDVILVYANGYGDKNHFAHSFLRHTLEKAGFAYAEINLYLSIHTGLRPCLVISDYDKSVSPAEYISSRL